RSGCSGTDWAGYFGFGPNRADWVRVICATISCSFGISSWMGCVEKPGGRLRNFSLVSTDPYVLAPIDSNLDLGICTGNHRRMDSLGVGAAESDGLCGVSCNCGWGLSFRL